MLNNEKSVIILLGPPGAGKGTQAELLSEKLGFYYLETSKIIESNVMKAGENEMVEIDGKKYYSQEEKKLWETGKLCSPPFVTYLIKKEIQDLFQKGESLILAGSPRTIYEGEKLIPLLKKL